MTLNTDIAFKVVSRTIGNKPVYFVVEMVRASGRVLVSMGYGHSDRKQAQDYAARLTRTFCGEN